MGIGIGSHKIGPPPTPPQVPAGLGATSTPNASPLAQKHGVKFSSGGISRFASNLVSSTKSALRSLSHWNISSSTPPTDGGKVTPPKTGSTSKPESMVTFLQDSEVTQKSPHEPFKSLGEAQGAFVNFAKQKMSVQERNAMTRIGQRDEAESLDKAGMVKHEKVNLFQYTDNSLSLGYNAMNGLIRAKLDPSTFATGKMDEAMKSVINDFEIDKMAARCPQPQREEFRKFATEYILCAVAQKAVTAREAMAKMPLHEGITDRGMIAYPGKVDILKASMSSPGNIDLLKEAAFSSSTTNVQTPSQIRDSDENHAKFSNEITLLTICRSGRDVKALSATQSEAEVLYPADARFEVFGHKELESSSPAGVQGKAKDIFFQVELSSDDQNALKTLGELKKKMDADPSYKPDNSEKQALTHAGDFNKYVNTQMQEFSKRGWDGDLAPPLPNTCKFFNEVISEAAIRTS